MPVHPDRPIAIYHEHPDWFRPLFTELERRAVPYVRLDAAHHRYEPGAPRPPYALVVNRMSPSAWRRGVGHSILYTAQYLDQLERYGVRVVNGTQAFLTEIGKIGDEELEKFLDRASKYNPTNFKNTLAEIAKQLPVK